MAAAAVRWEVSVYIISIYKRIEFEKIAFKNGLRL